MNYIHRLPFILSAFIAIIIGMINFLYNVNFQDIYIRMAIGMIIFFVLGMYIRDSFEKIDHEIKGKRQEEQQTEQNSSAGQESEQIEKQTITDEKVASVISYMVDGYGEDFSPLEVSEIINTKEK